MSPIGEGVLIGLALFVGLGMIAMSAERRDRAVPADSAKPAKEAKRQG